MNLRFRTNSDRPELLQCLHAMLVFSELSLEFFDMVMFQRLQVLEVDIIGGRITEK